MKKYIFTENQMKKVLDTLVAEQNDFMGPINKQLANAPVQKRLFKQTSPFATIHLIKPGETFNSLVKGFDRNSTLQTNVLVKDINNIPAGYYLALEPGMGD